MDLFSFFLVVVAEAAVLIGAGVDGTQVDAAPSHCPLDYKQRVETCIMEAKVAPQAGGGLSLVISNDTITDLCHRGLLRKTIDCLQEVHTRCAHNVSTSLELERLYHVPSWQQGAQLLCEDTELFHSNQDCLAKTATSVMTCVLVRTNAFRLGLALSDKSDHAGIREVTCDFAESIVQCLRKPIHTHCPAELEERIAESLYLFLPPFCLTDNYITVRQEPEATDDPKNVKD